ncbi:MAG: MBL fold metallo-hydrolase [Erysipelotrichaceae bacterium]|nr:MBL fold metallo-hydrolase [Erysipelotrichaceae bacterium]
MRIHALASGSKGNCFILEFSDDVRIMIDCGTTQKYLKAAMKQLDISMADIAALLITHEHSDHIAQMKMFKALKIYSPVCFADYMIESVRPFEKFMIKGIEILPLVLSHDASITVGYIFDDGCERVAYITDTGYVSERYFPLLKDIDHIVIESNHNVQMLMESARPMHIKRRILGANGHLCNEDCADVLSRIIGPKTKGIMLAHLSLEANDPAVALATNVDYFKNNGIDVDKITIKVCKQFEIVTLGD